MILFEKSIVIAAIFLLIVLFIGYLGIKVKDRKYIEGMKDNSTSYFNNSMYQQLKNEQTAFQNKITTQLKKMQKLININTNGVNDYIQNRDKLSKAMNSLE